MHRGSDPATVGRYAIHEQIAAGGMASVHLARLLGPVGFTKPVAIKRLHPHLAKDPDVVTMLVDEARIASRVRHANVVPILDVISERGEVYLVLEYVHGESLARLLRLAPEPPPAPVVVAIVCGILHGLHAAHEARGADGAPLEIIHRDVSPQNVLVGDDGVARVIDFGVAKARGRLHTTLMGQVKGKPAYMAPEQWSNAEVTRRVDIYASAVVLKEALMLAPAQEPDGARSNTENRPTGIPESVLPILLKALRRAPEERFESAREMALALEAAITPATPSVVAEWVKSTARESLATRAAAIADIEAAPQVTQRHAVPVARTSPARVSSRGSRRWHALGIGLALGLLLIAVYFARRREPEPAASTPPAVPVVEALGAATATESSAPAPVEGSRPPLPTSSAGTVKRAPRARAASECNPPYDLDLRGKRSYKLECLR